MVLTTTNTWQILPVDPIASGNFTNIATNNAADGVYTINGSSAALDDIIDLAHGDTFFDPEIDIDVGGIKARDVGGGSFDGVVMALQAALVAQFVPNGFTIVYDFYCSAVTDMSAITYVNGGGSEFNSIQSFQYGNFNDRVRIEVTATDAGSASLEPSGAIESAVNRLAITVTPDGGAASMNGGAIVTLSGSLMAATCNGIDISMGGDGDARLRSFAFYEPVDNADLPALSAL